MPLLMRISVGDLDNPYPANWLTSDPVGINASTANESAPLPETRSTRNSTVRPSCSVNVSEVLVLALKIDWPMGWSVNLNWPFCSEISLYGTPILKLKSCQPVFTLSSKLSSTRAEQGYVPSRTTAAQRTRRSKPSLGPYGVRIGATGLRLAKFNDRIIA